MQAKTRKRGHKSHKTYNDLGINWSNCNDWLMISTNHHPYTTQHIHYLSVYIGNYIAGISFFVLEVISSFQCYQKLQSVLLNFRNHLLSHDNDVRILTENNSKKIMIIITKLNSFVFCPFKICMGHSWMYEWILLHFFLIGWVIDQKQ